MRLGKWDSTNTNLARPIKLRFQEAAIATNFMKASKNLKMMDQWRSLSIARDNTPKQREMYRSVKAELNSRINKGETNLKIIYKNGVPVISRAGN